MRRILTRNKMPGVESILKLEDLTIRFHTREGLVTAVDCLQLSLRRGQVLGVVGESGCGKSVMSRSLIRIEAPGKIEAGHIRYLGRDGSKWAIETLHPAGRQMRAIRWKEIAMIFQEPMASFGPQHTIGDQIAEAMAIHGFDRQDSLADAVV